MKTVYPTVTNFDSGYGKIVDGKKFSDGKWYYSDGTPVWNAMIPTEGSGNSLRLQGASTFFEPFAVADTFAGYFLCEYDVKPVPQKAPTTSTAFCKNTYSIWGSGTPKKNICRVESGANPVYAAVLCRNNGMDLFTVKSQIDRDGVYDIMKLAYPTTTSFSSGFGKTVDGRRASNGKMYYYDGGELWSGAIPSTVSDNYVKMQGAGTSFEPVSIPNASGWFLCEYDVNLPTKSNTLVKSICASTYDIYESGVFRKGICRVTAGQSPQNAAKNCRSNGMNLLAIRKQIDKDAVYQIMRLGYPGQIGFTGYSKMVDGFKAPNGKWYYFDGSPMWSGMIPSTGSGNYMAVEGADQVFNPKTIPDTITSGWYLCEYYTV